MIGSTGQVAIRIAPHVSAGNPYSSRKSTRETAQSGPMDSLVRAFESLYDQLPAVAWKPLALALVLHLGRAAARSRAWRNVLAAAYPDEDVRWRSIFAAYAA